MNIKSNNYIINKKGFTLIEIVISLAIITVLFLTINIVFINYYSTYNKILKTNSIDKEINTVYMLIDECVEISNQKSKKITIEILSDEHTIIYIEDEVIDVEFLYDELGCIYTYYNGIYINVLKNIKEIEINITGNLLKIKIIDWNEETYKRNYYIYNT